MVGWVFRLLYECREDEGKPVAKWPSSRWHLHLTKSAASPADAGFITCQTTVWHAIENKKWLMFVKQRKLFCGQVFCSCYTVGEIKFGVKFKDCMDQNGHNNFVH